VFLVSNLLLRGRGQGATFWSIAALTSSVEGFTSRAFQHEHPVLAAEIFLEDYALNTSQAAVFRKCGFIPSALVRLVFYLVWHILWGGWLASS
jgi:hypothetical protein